MGEDMLGSVTKSSSRQVQIVAKLSLKVGSPIIGAENLSNTHSYNGAEFSLAAKLTQQQCVSSASMPSYFSRQVEIKLTTIYMYFAPSGSN